MHNCEGEEPERAFGVKNEQRRVQRRPADTIQSVLIHVGSREVRAQVTNISILGIGIIADLELDPGTDITLDPLTRPGLGIKARIMHKRSLGESRWLLGCAFAGILGLEDLLALG